MDNIDSRRGIHLPAMPAAAAHVAPFVVWLLWMLVPGLTPVIGYTGRTAATLLALALCRPWRWYRGLQFRHVPVAVIVGALVYWIWVLPESSWIEAHAGWLYHAYQRFGILGDVTATPAFAPANAGWLYTMIRLCGSAFVIALAEEFFWRGFAYRRLQQVQFLDAHPEHFSALAFGVVAIAFGFEHARWFVGIVAGIAYGLLYVRTRNLWAAILAHVVTNWLLGLHVLRTQAYQFW